MIKMSWKNLISMLQNERLIAVMILMCVCASTIIIFFSYGIYQHFHVVLTDARAETQEINIAINDPSAVSKSKLLNCIYSLPDEINAAVKMYFLTPLVDVKKNDGSIESDVSYVTCRFAVYRGQIKNSELLESNLKTNGNLRGDYYSEEAQHNGERVALLSETRDYSDSGISRAASYVTRKENGREFLTVENEEYEIIGYSPACIIDVPILSLDDSVTFGQSIDLDFGSMQSDMITKRQYEIIKDTFESNFGTAVTVPELELPDQRTLYYYRTIMLVAVLISMLAALNYSQLYSYIMDQRKRTIAIIRICGCTPNKAVCIFLLECLILTIPPYIISAFFFAKAVLPALKNTYPYMQGAFSPIIYVCMTLIYFGSAILVLWVILRHRIKKCSILEMQKRG